MSAFIYIQVAFVFMRRKSCHDKKNKQTKKHSDLTKLVLRLTTLRQLLTNIKDRHESRNRQGAVYKINCSDCHASYIGETGRNLTTRLTEHKRATRKHHRLTNHTIDWDSAQCLAYSTNYFQRLTLESWFTNLEQTPLNRCQTLPAPYKRLIHDINITKEPNRTT